MTIFIGDQFDQACNENIKVNVCYMEPVDPKNVNSLYEDYIIHLACFY